ncbi:MAG: hypothetical protein AAF363_18665 [Bacteroidota bacterium]
MEWLKGILNVERMVFIAIILVLASLWGKRELDYRDEKRELLAEKAKSDSVIAVYDSVFEVAHDRYSVHIDRSDSLEKIIKDHDTVIYTLSADSVLRSWAERFGHD